MVVEFLFKVWTRSLDTKEKSISNLSKEIRYIPNIVQRRVELRLQNKMSSIILKQFYFILLSQL